MSATVTDTIELTQEEREFLAKRREQAAKAKTATKLKTPVIFWNERYPGEKVHDPSLDRPIKFALGQFTATTEEQAAVLRRVGSHIFEGVDLEKPMKCDACGKDFWNRSLYSYHMNRHAQ